MKPALRSLTLRLTLMFVAVSALVLISVGVVLGLAVERHFEEQDLTELGNKLTLIRRVAGKLHAAADLDRLPALLDDALLSEHGLAIAIHDGDGRLRYAGMHGAAVFPAGLPLAAWAAERPLQRQDLQVWTAHGSEFRGLSQRLATGLAGHASLTVAIALDIEHHQQFMSAFRHTLWFAVACGIAGCGLLGWGVARRGLLPLRRMAAVATGISAQRLHDRLAEDDVPSEMADLAAAFNAMLGRLEDAFRRLSDFSSDLAHELRTPISNLMMQSEVALSQARSGEDYREVLYSALEEYERLSRIIADMLFLAKADNGQLTAGDAPVDLAGEVRELCEFFQLAADDQGVSLSVSGEGQVRGDRLMLRRAVGNLLSNAIRHSPAGGTVSVSLTPGRGAAAGWLTLSVSNPGPAIAAEHLPRLFDRFYRADPARQREEGSEGTGLGLAITRSIIAAHGGEIGVTSGSEGTCFTLRLPA